MMPSLHLRSVPVAALIVLAACAGPRSGLPGHSAATSPTCAQTVDSLDAKLRGNYAGFKMEIVGARLTSYDSLRRVVHREARARAMDSCYPVLARYINWFNDPHLFVFQSQTTDSATAIRRQRALRRLPIDEGAMHNDLLARRDSLDPIEGIWYEGATRIGIVRDPDGKAGHFAGIVLTSDTVGWPVGAVRADFARQSDGSYATTLLTRGFAELQLTARIHRRVILRLSPGMWGKAFPLRPQDAGSVDPADVHRPRLTVRSRSVVVAVPSHDPSMRPVLDSMISLADQSIRRTGLLIVDLRGNEGGSSQTTRALDPYITTTERRPTPFDSGVPVMLSSPAQIAYARRSFGAETSPFVRSLVARLEARPGAMVPLEERPSAPAFERVLDGDWRVVILVDRGTVSAAEVLVLRALRSSRAVVIGEATAGALDYQSIQIVRLGTGDTRWALGYPTIAAHADLPQGGMRGRGIAPSVLVHWDTINDAMAFIEERYGSPPPSDRFGHE